MKRAIDNASIVIVGVGGQGTLLASRILGAFAIARGLDVKVSEVHGMAQRGGTVITYVRMGKSAMSPLIENGGADFVLAFEQMEAMRALSYLKTDGVVISNTQKISPMSVVTGVATYPTDIEARLTEKCAFVPVDAFALAMQAGESRSVNLVLIGALCTLTGGDAGQWEEAIRACVPEKLLSVNLKAFELGMRAAE